MGERDQQKDDEKGNEIQIWRGRMKLIELYECNIHNI